ncbi:hypothetical protein SK128_006046, partial [Halocaridina rubra]
MHVGGQATIQFPGIFRRGEAVLCGSLHHQCSTKVSIPISKGDSDQIRSPDSSTEVLRLM